MWHTCANKSNCSKKRLEAESLAGPFVVIRFVLAGAVCPCLESDRFLVCAA